MPHGWVSQCSQSYPLDSTWWCSLHCRHTFWLQLCIAMLQQHLYTNQNIYSQPDGFATSPCGEPDYVHCHGRGEDFSASLQRQQTVGGQGWHIFPPTQPTILQSTSNTCQHLFLWQHMLGSGHHQLYCHCLWSLTCTYTPNRLFSRDSWGLGWCFDSSTKAYFFTAVFYLAEKPLVGVASQRKLVFSLLRGLTGFPSTNSSSS